MSSKIRVDNLWMPSVWVIFLVLGALAGCMGPGEQEVQVDGTESSDSGTGSEDGPDGESANGDDEEEKMVETVKITKYRSGLVGPYILNGGCGIPDLVGPKHVGGACMEVPPATTTINVTIEDDAGFHVAFDASFVLHDGSNPHDGWHCDKANMSPPQDAKYLSIAIEGPLIGNVECLDDGPHAPTQGTITSTFRHTLQGTVD